MTQPRTLKKQPQGSKSASKSPTKVHTPSAKDEHLSAHAPFEDYCPFAQGLNIINADPQCNPTKVLYALLPAIANPSLIPGMAEEECDRIDVLISGNARHIEHAKIIAAASPPPEGVSYWHKYISAQDKLNWTSEGGLLLLAQHLNKTKGDCLVAELVISGPITTEVALGLARIRAMAKEFEVELYLIVSAPSTAQPALKQVSDGYLEVLPCEADLGVQTAFTIDCPGLGELGLGVGKAMVSINYSDGKFRYSYTPFISDSLDKRIVWTMRGLDKTLEEIGAKLKINKSTVLRRLKDLPPTRRLKDAEEWLSPYFEATSSDAVASPDSSTLDADWDDGNPSGDADGA